MKVLVRQKHGLGDNMQAALVVKHLKHYHKDWQIDVEARRGAHSCFYGIADNVYVMGTDRRARLNQYDQTFQFPFPRPKWGNCEVPSTKVTRCLDEYFPDCKPLEELYEYEIHPSDEAHQVAERYVKDTLDGLPFAILHYQGISSPEDKDLQTWEAQLLVDMMRAQGLIPIVLSWKPDELYDVVWVGPGHELWHIEDSNGKNGDAGVMGALASHAQYWMGIDSGPEHVMGGTNTPGFVFWLYHHPCHCYDFGRDVTHLIPPDLQIAACDPLAHEYFLGHYKHQTFCADEGEEYDFTSWLEKETKEDGLVWKMTNNLLIPA